MGFTGTVGDTGGLRVVHLETVIAHTKVLVLCVVVSDAFHVGLGAFSVAVVSDAGGLSVILPGPTGPAFTVVSLCLGLVHDANHMTGGTFSDARLVSDALFLLAVLPLVSGPALASVAMGQFVVWDAFHLAGLAFSLASVVSDAVRLRFVPGPSILASAVVAFLTRVSNTLLVVGQVTFTGTVVFHAYVVFVVHKSGLTNTRKCVFSTLFVDSAVLVSFITLLRTVDS